MLFSTIIKLQPTSFNLNKKMEHKVMEFTSQFSSGNQSQASKTCQEDKMTGNDVEEKYISYLMEGITTAQLKDFIMMTGLSHADCIEKSELRERAKQASFF